MTAYIGRRLFHSIFVLLGLMVVVFFVTRMIGDPARLMLPAEASEEQYRALRQSLGLDDPVYIQFLHFAPDVARGNFGDSLWQKVPALDLVLQRLPATLLLASSTIVLAVIIAIPMGCLSALRPRSLADRICTVFSLAGVSVAEFWLGLMLITLLAVKLGLLPSSGYGEWRNLILPSLSMAFRPIGRIAQVTRSSMLDELGKAYLTTARAKGLRERVCLFRHALKNAAIPIITLTGDEVAGLVNGAVVMETVFGWPGVGLLAIDAITKRDLPLLEANVFVVAVLVVLLNLVVDLTYAYVDPRVRYQ